MLLFLVFIFFNKSLQRQELLIIGSIPIMYQTEVFSPQMIICHLYLILLQEDLVENVLKKTL